MRNIGPPEIILVLLILVLLFGAKRLPDTARGIGRSLRIFKAETKGLRDDDGADKDKDKDKARDSAATHEPREVTGRIVETRETRRETTGPDGAHASRGEDLDTTREVRETSVERTER